MGCGASKASNNDVADDNNNKQQQEEQAQQKDEAAAAPAPAGGRKVQRTARKDIGARRAKAADERQYKLDGPTLTTDDGWQQEAVIEGGLLLKLTNDDAQAFYNDSADFEMHIDFAFGPDSDITTLGDTERGTDAADNWITAKLVVYPNETKEFIRGAPNGMRGKYNPEALSAEYLAKVKEAAAAKIAEEQAAVAALGIEGKSDAEVLELCAAKGVRFVDPSFPPCRASLQREGIDQEPIADSAWRRPTEFLPEKERNTITLINGAEPDDIDQGAIGDCWFLCSVASLAEFPEKVHDVFTHPVSEAAKKKENDLGGYRVTFMKHGWWRMVVVDDYFPVAAAGLPRFSKNVQDRSELWVAILEKAYAKIHGSYSAIVGGDPLFAMQDLSGYPITRFDTEWKEALESREGSNKLFAQMERYDKAGYMLSLSTPGEDTASYNASASNEAGMEDRYKKAGLALGHAYSVLTVKSFPDKDVNLVRIRNPWGNATEWTGAWSDDDAKWKEHGDIAKACEFEAASDGTFWMEWADVKDFFDGGGCCFTCFDWHDYRIKSSLSGGKSSLVLEITVEKDLEAFVIVSQEDTRGRPGASYAGVLVSIATPDEERPGNYKAIRHGCSDADTESTEFTFLKSRDVAMKHRFAARAEPYVILLREYAKEADERPIGIGLISERKAGDGFSVKMVAPPEECKYYENFPTFAYTAGAAEGVDTPWQYNPEVGTAVEFRGSALTH